MTIQIEFSYVIGLLITIVGGFWAMAKLLVAQSQKHIDAQFKTIGDTLSKQDEGTRRIERELMDLKAELPRDYVRREDHNRVVGSIHLSIDNLRLTIERAIFDEKRTNK